MRRLAGLVLLAGSLAFLGVTLAKTYHRLPGGTLHLRPAYAIGAILAVAVANTLTAFVWRSVLASRRMRIPASEALRILSLSQLGKYLPGGFWQPLGWVGLAREAGVPAGLGSVTIATTMILTVAGALVVGPVLLAASGAAGAFVWLLLLVPAALVALHPRVLSPVLAFASRVTRRPGLDAGVARFGTVAGGLAVMIPIWFVYGLGLELTALAVRLGSWGDWVLLSGAFAVAWAVGFLAIPVPGGLGVREAILLLLLRSSFTTAEAIAIAVASRLVFILAEALMTLVALAIPHRKAFAAEAEG